MKVARKDTVFEPITITLESQHEIDLIADLLALAGDSSLYAATVMFNSLKNYSPDPDNYILLKEGQELVFK